MRNMTRGEVAKVVVRAKGIAINTTGGPHFSDVPTTDGFYDVIETLYNTGVVSGFSDGMYRPSRDVTRGEFSKIIGRTWSIPIDITAAPHFTDLGESSGSFQYVETLLNNGIISGYSDSTFRQDNPVLRQEVAKMVDRTMMKTSFNPGSGARISIFSTSDAAIANCNAQIQFVVTPYDRLGNLDNGTTASLTVRTDLGTFVGTGTESMTGAFQNGRATFDLRSCIAGVARVTATTASTITASDTATFSLNPIQPINTFAFSADPTSIEANCMSPSVLAFTVLGPTGSILNTYDGAVTGTVTVGRFIASGGTATTGTTSQVVTAVSGAGSFRIASCTAGTATITLRASTVEASSRTVTVVVSSMVIPTTIVITPVCIPATDATTTHTLTVRDQSGALLVGAGVTLTSTGTPDVTLLPSGSQTTNASGQITFTSTAPATSALGSETLSVAVVPASTTTTTILTEMLTIQASCT